MPDFKALVDGIFFDGPNGTLASGRFLGLQYVPPACPASVSINDVISGAFTSCVLGDKELSGFSGLEEYGGGASMLNFVASSPTEYVITIDNFTNPGVTSGFNFGFTTSAISGTELINDVDYAVYTAIQVMPILDIQRTHHCSLPPQRLSTFLRMEAQQPLGLAKPNWWSSKPPVP